MLGIGLDLACNGRIVRENIIEKILISFAFERTPRMSLDSKLIPVPYQEYNISLQNS